MIKCLNCNAIDHEDAAKFCHICGTKLLGNNDVATITLKRFRPVFPSNTIKLVNETTIDLGLPSGTRWAAHNIGALRPHETGDFYAWGDIKGKECYDWSSYMHCNGKDDGCYNLGNTICGTKYDVAHMRSGGVRQIPSIEQIKELINPAAGVLYNSSLGCLHNDGRYWSGTPGSDSDYINCALNFDNQRAYASNGWGLFGQTVVLVNLYAQFSPHNPLSKFVSYDMYKL